MYTKFILLFSTLKIQQKCIIQNFKQYKSKKLENFIYISKTIAIKMQTILAELHINLQVENKFLTSNSCFY